MSRMILSSSSPISRGMYITNNRAVSIATQEAGRFNSNIVAYEIPLSRSFEPEVYYDISDVIDDK